MGDGGGGSLVFAEPYAGNAEELVNVGNSRPVAP